MEIVNKIGRRKTSVARLYMESGKGEFNINGKSLESYFPSDVLQIIVKQPLMLVEQNGNFDFKVNVNGGGPKGQAPLKKEGFLTRDPRMVERKKPGRRKARRAFQFSKR